MSGSVIDARRSQFTMYGGGLSSEQHARVRFVDPHLREAEGRLIDISTSGFRVRHEGRNAPTHSPKGGDRCQTGPVSAIVQTGPPWQSGPSMRPNAGPCQPITK